MAGGRILVGGEIYQDIKYLEKILVYVEGTLDPSISLLEIGRILCLLLKDGREIMPTCRCKNSLTIEE
jgi:hypothetical protein